MKALIDKKTGEVEGVNINPRLKLNNKKYKIAEVQPCPYCKGSGLEVCKGKEKKK